MGIIPAGWDTETADALSKQTAQGRVHSGQSSVNLEDGAILTQTVLAVHEGCFYEFSFFAHGEGSNIGFTAISQRPAEIQLVLKQKSASKILSDSNRTFSYFSVITTAAPVGVTAAIISFSVTADGKQSMDLDDVSFIVSQYPGLYRPQGFLRNP